MGLLEELNEMVKLGSIRERLLSEDRVAAPSDAGIQE